MRHDAATLAQGRRKAEAVAESFGINGIDAMALSRDDWRLGSDWIRATVKKHELPVLAANLVCGGERPFPASKVVERGGWRVGVVGLVDDDIDGCKMEPAVEAVAAAVKELGDTDVTVVLAPARSTRIDLFLDGVAGVDFVVANGGNPRTPVEPGPGSSWVLAPSPRGKYLGVATLTWTGGDGWLPQGRAEALEQDIKRLERRREAGERRLQSARTDSQKTRREVDLKKLTTELGEARSELAGLQSGDLAKTRNGVVVEAKPLDRSIADHPATAELVAATLKDLAELEGVAESDHAVARLVDGDGPWAGAEACKSCHAAEYEQWRTTRHAYAWASLVLDNHHADRDCVSCHSTAWGEEGGPTSPAEVRGYRDVQCESCHGPGRAHVAKPEGVHLITDPGMAGCTRCHDGVRDEGRFDYGTYRPKVVHGPNLLPPPGPVPPPTGH